MMKTTFHKLAVAAALGLAAVTIAAPALTAEAPDAAQLEKGKTLFKSGAVPACAVCHTLQDAGTSGAIGPNLDELKPDMDRVLKVLKSGLGAMPSYATTMSEDDMKAVAAYVSHVTK
jgi:mono/diheme cytochrome c family protein